MTTDTLQPGRDLDAKIATLMGWYNIRWIESEGKSEMVGEYQGLRYAWAIFPRYSTDIAAAWQVVDALYERGYNVALNCYHGWETRHECEIAPDADPQRWQNANADTMPHAICLAALKAVGVEPTT